MKRSKWNSTFLCWKEVGGHNCRLNSSLRTDFWLLMDTHKIALFSKNDTFIRIILEDTIALQWKKIICNIYIYQPEADAFIGVILDDTIALNGKDNLHIICIYLPETLLG